MVSRKLCLQTVLARIPDKILETFIHHQKNIHFPADTEQFKQKFPVRKHPCRIIRVAEKNHIQVFMKPVNKTVLDTELFFFLKKHMLHLCANTFQCLLIFGKGRHRDQRPFGSQCMTK